MSAGGPHSMDHAEAFRWLDALVSSDDLENMWRVEINSSHYIGVARVLEVRAYPLEGHAGWCAGQGETLHIALCWLRAMIEDRGKQK